MFRESLEPSGSSRVLKVVYAAALLEGKST
jgi:hypothetical protein